ncbi:MAG: gamma-glutamylcyclotransferase [Yoonia sp.]|uniref:gamma-glutamylcyclotransferase n=1 Tax=Yoonia sp. TaxID=2212373 RepID=UPI003267D5FF
MAFWVFGYGSLLWNPGFEPAEKVRATLKGYHRSFCMLSIHHRGTDDDPGLVLALDEADATCTGLALRVDDAHADNVLAYLRERELVSSAYLEKHVTLHADDGRDIEALAYVINPGHVQYCQFDLEKQAQIIATAVGGRGPNTEYLYNTADLLAELKIPDSDMDWLVTRVREIAETA